MLRKYVKLVFYKFTSNRMEFNLDGKNYQCDIKTKDLGRIYLYKLLGVNANVLLLQDKNIGFTITLDDVYSVPMYDQLIALRVNNEILEGNMSITNVILNKDEFHIEVLQFDVIADNSKDDTMFIINTYDTTYIGLLPPPMSNVVDTDRLCRLVQTFINSEGLTELSNMEFNNINSQNEADGLLSALYDLCSLYKKPFVIEIDHTKLM